MSVITPVQWLRVNLPMTTFIFPGRQGMSPPPPLTPRRGTISCRSPPWPAPRAGRQVIRGITASDDRQFEGGDARHREVGVQADPRMHRLEIVRRREPQP